MLIIGVASPAPSRSEPKHHTVLSAANAFDGNSLSPERKRRHAAAQRLRTAASSGEPSSISKRKRMIPFCRPAKFVIESAGASVDRILPRSDHD
jgi:hypothetical protein